MTDDDEAFEIHIYPNCVCANCPNNGRTKIFKRRDCSLCFEHETKEYLGEYTSEQFHLVCKNNPQYRKIVYNEYDCVSDDSSVDASFHLVRHQLLATNFSRIKVAFPSP